jgi:hypothetical protein
VNQIEKNQISNLFAAELLNTMVCCKAHTKYKF